MSGQQGNKPSDFVLAPEDPKNFPAWRRSERIKELEEARPLLIKYCQLKLDQEDFHGVQDAASDLRDLDNELDGLRY